MRSPRRLTTALVIAFALSGGFTFLLSRKLDRQANLQRAHTTLYVAPARAIQAGEVLKPGDLRTIGWPASSPVQGGMVKIEDAVGRSALYPLDPGQPLLDRDLSTAGAGLGLASKIPNGMRAIALRSDEVVGVAGFLAPGSHLDVLVTYHTELSPDPVTATVLQNAEVVAAGSQLEPDPTSKTLSATVVTLLLTPQQAERAVLASTQGSIHFVLRNSTDTSTTESAPISLAQLTGAGPVAGALPKTPTPSITPNFMRQSKAPIVAGPAPQQLQIETILGGDQASVSKGIERAQP